MTPLAELIGDSPGIVAIRETVGRLLQRQSEARRLPALLMQGETGTGKGLLARAIHRASPRAAGPFVDVNCAAIPETLLEAELFGFERGAFTDARQAKPGLFQAAHRGTLFLDEVALTPEGLQAKLLTALEERAVRRLGSTRSESVDVWIITASNADLAAAVRDRRFREDLYHRLAVVTLSLPPLRERGDDVLGLAEHFLARACADYRLPAKALLPEARAALGRYRWPGNVRELANVMERVALLSEAPAVTADMLALPASSVPAPEAAEGEETTLETALGNVEREHVTEALRDTGWNVTRAAARLGISRDTLRYRISKHGLRPGGPAPARRRAPRPREPAPPPPATAGTGPGAPLALRWERRRLALLRAALIPPPDADPRLHPSRAVEVLVDKIQSFGGRIEELGLTELGAAFGLEPLEDAPRRAAHAAMAIQNATVRAADTGGALAVKCAVHVAPLLIGRGSGSAQIDLEGKREAWALLDTLVAAAEPGAIGVSGTAALFLERDFELAPIVGAGPGRAYRLIPGRRARGEAGRRMAPFVGRGHELELLQSRLALAMRGHGQVIGILGEAGIGKSRLLLEFHRSLLAMRDREGIRITYLEGRCEPYGKATPYLPVLDVLRGNFRITDADGPAEITTKVRFGLEEVGLDPDESAPHVFHLFGVKEGTERLSALSPPAVKARTFEVLRQLILSGARRRPIVFVIEDVHWMDPTSEECLIALMESAAAAPAMAVVTYRPGYRPPWLERSYATQIALQPLSPEDSLCVVRSVLDREEVPHDLARLILDRAEGNPFFAEELARAVVHGRELGPPGSVPDTIHDALLARIDPLAESAKRALQTAAVIGQEAPSALLKALWEGPGDLEADLRELLRLEFLYKLRGSLDPVYAFTHTLTQEMTYASLPVARRHALHAAAAEALESLFAGRLAEVCDRLAYHYSRAERADKAVEYLTHVAQRAARGHAHAEAVRTLEEAFAHVDRLPPGDQDRIRLDLVLHQADSLIPLGRFRDIVALLEGHAGELERVRDPARATRYHFLVGRSCLYLGDDERATRHAELAIAEAGRGADEASLGRIHYVLAQRGSLSGRMREGLEHGRQAVTLLTRSGEQWWLGPASWALGLNHAQLGEFGPALDAQARAAAYGDAVGDPQVQCSASWAAGVIHAARGDWDAGIAACQQAVERAPDPLNAAIALGWLGYAYLEQGAPTEAVLRLEEAIRRVGEFRFPQLLGWFTALLADAHRLAGRVDAAAGHARDALDITRKAAARYATGVAQRALGRVAHARRAPAEAATHLEAALDTFHAIEARYEVGRTHLDLAGVAGSRGDRDAAGRHLAEAVSIFAALGVPRYAARGRELASELGTPVAAAPPR